MDTRTSLPDVLAKAVSSNIAAFLGCKACDYLASTSTGIHARVSTSTPTVLLVNKDSAAIYDLKSGNYEVCTSIRTSYHDCAAVVCSGCLFVFGDQSSSSDVHKLDLETMAWEDVASMPTGRRGAVALEVEEYIYVIGGRVGGMNTAKTEKLHLDTEEWTSSPRLQFPRAYCSAVTMMFAGARRVYVLGGRGELSVELFEDGVWEYVVNMPVRRDVGCTAIAVSQSIYVIGGWNPPTCPRVDMSIDQLDLNSLTWWSLASADVPHSYFPQALELDGAIYVFGGSPNRPVSRFEPWTRRWKYLPGTGYDAAGGGWYVAHLIPSQACKKRRDVIRGSHELSEAGSPQGTHGADTEESVIQLVQHADAAEQMDPVDAAMFTVSQWAGFIERLEFMDPPAQVAEDDTPSQINESLFLLKLNRNPASARREFSAGPSLKQCRDALEANGHEWKHLSGALIFVHPWQYRRALIALRDEELHPDHIVVAASFEHLLEEAMSPFEGRKGIWVKSRDRFQGTSSSDVATRASSDVAIAGDEAEVSESASSSDAARRASSIVEMFGEGAEVNHESNSTDQYLVVVKRTFITLVPAHSESESAVTQSTTDAHSENGGNPRRNAHESLIFF